MANTLAYYGTATITAVKSFIVQAPGNIFLPSLIFVREPGAYKKEAPLHANTVQLGS